MLVFFNFDIRFQMLSDKSTVCPNNLLDLAHRKKGLKVAIVNAGTVSYTHLRAHET